MKAQTIDSGSKLQIISNRTYMYLKVCAILREFLNIILKCKSLYVHVLIFINLRTNKIFLKKSKLYLILLL